MKIRMRETQRGPFYEAIIWHKNGDHPEDHCETFIGSDGEPFQGEGKVVRYFRHPGVPGDQKCELCGSTMHEHGWIDQSAIPVPHFMPRDSRVCPSGAVISIGGAYFSVSPPDFKKLFEVFA